MYHDLLGLGEGPLPRFVEQYAALGDLAVEAVARYADDVRARRFPQERHTYAIPADELERFQRLVEAGAPGRRRGRRRRPVTGDELAALLATARCSCIDVRAAAEYDGTGGYPCDPVQGHIPGAVNVDVAEIAEAGAGVTALLRERGIDPTRPHRLLLPLGLALGLRRRACSPRPAWPPRTTRAPGTSGRGADQLS